MSFDTNDTRRPNPEQPNPGQPGTGQPDAPEGWSDYAALLRAHGEEGGAIPPSGLDDRIRRRFDERRAVRQRRRRVIRTASLPLAAVAMVLLFLSIDSYLEPEPELRLVQSPAPALDTLAVPAEETLPAPEEPAAFDVAMPEDIGIPFFPSIDAELSDSTLFEIPPVRDTPVTGM